MAGDSRRRRCARVGAAAFLVGAGLAGPQAGVASAEPADTETAAVSSAGRADAARESRAGREASRPDGADGRARGRSSVGPAPGAAVAARRGDRAAHRVLPSAAESAPAASKQQELPDAPAGDDPVAPVDDGPEVPVSLRSPVGVEPMPQWRGAPANPALSGPADGEDPDATPVDAIDWSPYAPAVAESVPVVSAAPDLHAVVNGVFDTVSRMLAALPGNPVAEFLSGALLLVRRTLFNQAPTAMADQVFLGSPPDFAVEATLDVTDPEQDALTFTVVSAPTSGTVRVAADGSFVYTPNDPARFGTDEFVVAVADNGFTLLDPFGSRSTTVRVTVGRESLAGYTQGFDIINLTDEVLWLTKIGVAKSGWAHPDYADVADWIDGNCTGENFCLTSMVGRSLQPGEAIPFQAKTEMGVALYMMFSSNTGRNWGVRVVPRDWGMDDSNKIDTQYEDGPPRTLLSNGPDSAVPVGRTPGTSWFGTQWTVVDWTPIKTGAPPCAICLPGSWTTTPLQPVAYSTQNGNRLFLTQGAGRTYDITSGTVWAAKPPEWCDYCAPVTVTPQSVLNNFLKANPQAPDGSGYPQYQKDFTPEFKNVTLDKFVIELAGADNFGNRIQVLNRAGNEGVTVTKSGTIELNPGPGIEKDPSAPWWRNPAGQAAGGLASFLLGKFVGEGIATAIGGAIGGVVAPADVPKKITATTTSATITPLPHSLSLLTTSDGVSRYMANGDITYTVGVRDGAPTVFRFTKMDFVVNDPTSVKDGQTLNARFETVPYQEPGESNVGFRLSDKASWNSGLGVRDTNPTYRVDPAVAHALGMELYLGSAKNAVGEDSSGQACGGDKTSNCATFTVQSDDPSVTVAEVTVLPSNQAVLVAKAPGTATVTATYTWRIEVGGPLQALTGTVKATMGVTVTA